MDSSDTKTKLKKWEREFLKENGRKPNKDDVMQASPDIKDIYRKYWKAKCLTKSTDVEKTSTKTRSSSDVWDSSLNKPKSDARMTEKIKITLSTQTKYFSRPLPKTSMSRKKVLVKPAEKEPPPAQPNIETEEPAVEETCPSVRSPEDGDDDDRSLANFSGFRLKIINNFPVQSKSLNVFSSRSVQRPAPSRSRSFIDADRDELCLDSLVLKQRNDDLKSAAHGEVVARFERSQSVDEESEPSKLDEDAVVESSTSKSGTVESKCQSSSSVVRQALGMTLPVRCPEFIDEGKGELAGCSPKRKATKRSAKLIEVDEEEEEDLPRPKKRIKSCRPKQQNKCSSENYVRINLKKKIFCRGKKKFNFRRYKYDRWKQLKKEKEFAPCLDEGGDCPEDFVVPESFEALGDLVAVQVPAARCQEEEEEKKKKTEDPEPSSWIDQRRIAEPVCSLVDGEVTPDVQAEIDDALRLFGHSQFRVGQLKTIKRILAGQSTLLIQPTGAGKSLCYLLPAYVYAKCQNAITIVVSPLVSLMEDQLSNVPKCLRAFAYHTGLSTGQREKIRDFVSAGKVDVLMLSPEAIVGGAGSTFGCLPRDMPPIAFVCIDEIHCVSVWSHNFRPSYLRLCRVLRDVLGVRCILGLTATAKVSTASNILGHLRVEDDRDAVVKSESLPANLLLSVSKETSEPALVELLTREPFVDCGSIIIYCIRREQTERVACVIRTCLQRESCDWSAEAYHAGLSSARRRHIQNDFMSGKLRVVVATVAFGMGLNKLDVRAVVHYNMPKSIESYVQEIGRAGRDGRPAYCHLFLDVQGKDRQELRRHIHSNSVDRTTVKKLLNLVFKPCRCNTIKEMEQSLSRDECSRRETWRCGGHEVAFVVEDTVEELDAREEVIDTLLCYLEAHSSRPIKLLNRTYAKCKLFSYGGTGEIVALAKKFPALAIAVALHKKKTTNRSNGELGLSNRIEFNVTEVARMVGQESSQLRRQLKGLQWETSSNHDGEVKYHRSNVLVEFGGVAFHLRAVGDLSDQERDDLVEYLHRRCVLQERSELEQLDKFHSVLQSVSVDRHSFDDPENEARSCTLKDFIRGHFKTSVEPRLEEEEEHSLLLSKELPESTLESDEVVADVRRFLAIHGDSKFNGRAVARIFHGIGSPRYPAEAWSKARQFWRCRLDVDFNVLCTLATREIVR